MRSMIDMIRSSSVSATIMQAAARGALAVPGAEMIEILVHIANHNKVFGQQARMTLAGWELKSSLEAASNPETSQEVLDYLIAPENLRPRLLPALLENPSIKPRILLEMAANGSREVVDAMLASSRVQASPEIRHALASNPNSSPVEVPQMAETPPGHGNLSQVDPVEQIQSSPEESPPVVNNSDHENILEDDAAVDAFLIEHARELVLEGDKPFQPLGGIQEFEVLAPDHASPAADPEVIPDTAPATPEVKSPATATTPNAATAARVTPAKKAHTGAETERGSALQKISKLDIKGRIQLAMKGSKEDRSILIRDSTKLVALAVLESPKITDGEVEKFASQKNVLEAVLRQIPMKRRFVKNYSVVRNLVANPRTPLDVSLGLMKNLLTADLKNLSGNKEVSDTIRKLALKMFKQKSDPSKKSQ